MFRVVGIVLALGGLAGAAGAQDANSCTVPPSVGSLPGVIRGSLRSVGVHTPPVGYTAAVLEAIGQAYPPDTALTLGVYLTSDSAATTTAFTALAFTVTDSGTMDDIVQVASSRSVEFDHNVIQALRAAGKSGLPRIPKGVGSSVRFELDADALPAADTAPPVYHGIKLDESSVVRMAWAATALPAWTHAKATGIVPGVSPVKYPEAARQRMLGDSVLVQLVVGPDGRAMPGTALLKHASYREFAQTVSEALSRDRFSPGTIGGCPVATVVVMPFDFFIKNSSF
jgi:hypothetical protein